MLRFTLALLCLCAGASLTSATLPANFYYGTATASYQIEGAWDWDGKQPGEWDLFSDPVFGKIAHNDTGMVADRGYEFALQDVQLLADMGVNAYRFSISWSRIIDASGNVNPKGIAHYDALIDALLQHGITPFITAFHWDMPLQYGTMMGEDGRGWLNATYIVPLFTQYMDTIFGAYGDRVKHWIVFNEPHSFCVFGFASGGLAPGRCSDRSHCDAGDTTTEPYTCGHTVLLAWSAVTNLWRSKYAPQFGPGNLGFSLDSSWAIPYTSSDADKGAAQRAMLWTLGWWADVLFLESHDYPAEMRAAVGDRLPQFTAQQKAEMATAVPDFFGFNHYSSFYAYYCDNSTDLFGRDQQSCPTDVSSEGVVIGPTGASGWLNVVPYGFPLVLNWIHERYPGVNIVVTENGVDVPGESDIPLPEVLHDTFRINYLDQYLSNLTEVAIAEMKLPVIGYFVWSLMDNFEWADGQPTRNAHMQ
jgi:beta-glucosidase